MSQAAVVARLALRELWMSFRLLAVLGAYVVAGASVALLPAATLGSALDRLALATGAAGVATAAAAAWTIATERRRGHAAWLVARSVTRGGVLSGWFAALGATAAVGHLVAAAIGWLVVLGLAGQPDLPGYLVAVLATLAASAAGVGLGTLAGLALAPAAAALATVAIVLAAALIVASGMAAQLIPGVGAFVVLSRADEVGQGIGAGMLAAGIALATAAVLLAVARLVLDRVDL